MSGTLYIVATPIGNLADLSVRAVEVLGSVDAIACEDTRTTYRLLQRYSIDTPRFSFHQHNEHRKVPVLMQMLSEGKSVALVSDAGTPGISDPGFLAVRQAHLSGFTVQAIPGASAALTALASSGIPCDRFLFEGFLPARKGRQTRLKELAESDVTVVLFESVHRIDRLAVELVTHFGHDRIVAVCRELTKLHEQIIRGPATEVAARISDGSKLRGEFVVVVSSRNYKETVI